MEVVNPENVNYYYLDGLEKKGPYNSEEIQARQLSLETLIFKDGSNSWLPLVNFPELQQPIKSIQSNEAPIESPEIAFDNLEKEKIKIPVLLIICLGFVISTALGFTFTKEHPFVAMSSEAAQEIFDKEEGFRLATPREVQDFYS